MFTERRVSKHNKNESNMTRIIAVILKIIKAFLTPMTIFTETSFKYFWKVVASQAMLTPQQHIQATTFN